MELGAGNAVLEAMNKHKGNAKVQQEGCGAMCRLCSRTDICKPLMKLGAIEALSSAMKSHLGNMEVQRVVCEVIANLARVPAVRAVLFEENAEDWVNEAKDRFEYNADLVAQANRALENLKSPNACSHTGIDTH